MFQAAFRKGYRTADHMFVLNTLLTKFLTRKRGRLFCAFVDFKAAFDSIFRQGLLFKLRNRDIQGKMFKIIEAMYKEVKACVKVKDGGYTDLFECSNGLKQGSQLSPFLFIFFVSDLEKELKEGGTHGISIGLIEVFHLLFADDLILVADSVRGNWIYSMAIA